MVGVVARSGEGRSGEKGKRVCGEGCGVEKWSDAGWRWSGGVDWVDWVDRVCWARWGGSRELGGLGGFTHKIEPHTKHM